MDLSKILFDLPEWSWFSDESRFSAWFGRQVKEKGWMYHKISDESRGMKPCDAVFAFEWIHWLIEFKVTAKKNYKPFKMLRWSSVMLPWFQVKGLTLYQKNGWLSLVAVYNKSNNTWVLIDFRVLLLNPDLVIWDKGIPFKTSIVVN